MKQVKGKSLQQPLSEKSISLGHALAKLSRIAAAIGLAHDSSIIHCNLKPANILVESQSGRPWVTDVYTLGAIHYRLFTGRLPILTDSDILGRTMQLNAEHNVVLPLR